MRVTGIGSVIANMKSFGVLVPDGARGKMKRAAARIVKRARIYVPEDTKALMESIRIEKSYGVHGRLVIDIIAGQMDETNRYAAQVHENYESMSPGAGTIAKRLKHPTAYIGSGFLSRATAEEEDDLRQSIVEMISHAILESGLQ